jgi:hypothetical protein
MHGRFRVRRSRLSGRFEGVFPRTGNGFGWIGQRIVQRVRQRRVTRESRPYAGTPIAIPPRHRDLIIF